VSGLYKQVRTWQSARVSATRPPRRVAVDLFSGPGGLTQGLRDAGFDVVAAIEMDRLAWETHRLNHPETLALHRNLWTFGPDQLRAWTGLEPGDLDLLAACPPCQGFSSLRTLNGNVAVADRRNDLVLRMLDYVDDLRPKAFLMENVPALAKDSRFTDLVDGLEALGYSVAHKVLNSADYGVPQNRRRLVLMASTVGPVDFGAAATKHRTVRDAIGALPAPALSADPWHSTSERRSAEVMRRIERIPSDGGSRLDLPADEQLKCHSGEGFNGFKDVYGRMAWSRPAPTITSGCHNPSKGRFLHPEQHRAITLREAALLQSFPPDYRFPEGAGKLAVAAMIGNALPPVFVAAHARQIRAVLDTAEQPEAAR
jgi:DNA (cytosine-5)-methyltransferase 1